MVSDANSSRLSGVTVSCDVPIVALYENGYKYELKNESGKIYIVDEDFGPLKTKEFSSLVLKSQNCFIIITRESLPGIPYSYKEIYKIKTSGKYHMLENIYEKLEQFEEQNFIVTEDEDAGLEYYQHFYGNKVISSHGNSNLSKYGNEETLLLAEITRNTPAQYTKSKLNQCYMEPCCCKNTKCEFFSRNKKLG